jgi:predicted nucleic acid-binding protein
MNVFFDTNILVYANDPRNSGKRDRALERLHDAIASHGAVISTQILSEFAAVSLSKLGWPIDFVMSQIRRLESIQIIPVTAPLVRRGIELHGMYQINFWDAQILAAAEVARCDVLLSEDLNPRQLYAGVRVENPFL